MNTVTKATILSCLKASDPKPYVEVWDVRFTYTNQEGKEITKEVRIAPEVGPWSLDHEGCVTFMDMFGDGVDIVFPVPQSVKDAMQRAQQEPGRKL